MDIIKEPPLLIVGLGNAGERYAKTRHNVGYRFVNRLADRFDRDFIYKKRYHAHVAEIPNTRLLRPTSFMNVSGRSVHAQLKRFKIEVTEVLIVHDEMDLAPGQWRYKDGGSEAGHNGLLSITTALGGNRNYSRLRIGVGKPAMKEDAGDYVLGVPDYAESEQIENAIEECVTNMQNAIELYVEKWHI